MGKVVSHNIEQVLKKYRAVGIDSMVFIYHLEAAPQCVPFTDVLFRLLEEGELEGITSTITLLEILVKPRLEGNNVAVEDYRMLLNTFPNLNLVGVDAQVAERASELRAKYGLKTPDAIQITAALVRETPAFVTNDSSLKKVGELDVLVMKEFLGKGVRP